MKYTPIDLLPLSDFILRMLIEAGITSIEELLSTPNKKLIMIRGIGQKAKTQIDQALHDRGFI